MQILELLNPSTLHSLSVLLYLASIVVGGYYNCRVCVCVFPLRNDHTKGWLAFEVEDTFMQKG